MPNIVFLLKKFIVFNFNILNIRIKYNKTFSTIYLFGFFGILNINLNLKKGISFFYLKPKFFNFWFELNTGWIGYLYLNGLGFKATRKLFNNSKKYWRFNVGHSHVFKYFTPKNIIMKVKNRNIFIFGVKKNQVSDIIKKIKIFRIPDAYKGVGIKYPNEIIILKKGKVRQ